MIHGVDTSFLVQMEVVNHPGHAAARALLDRLLANNDSLRLAIVGSSVVPEVPAAALMIAAAFAAVTVFAVKRRGFG